MKIISRDILTIESGIICHQCNNKGVMGAGIARQIRAKWPHVFYDYIDRFRAKTLKMGDCILTKVHVAPPLYIASLVGQDDFGSVGCYTDYDALEVALLRVANFAHQYNLPVYVPFGMSCGLAGGEWDRVTEIIDRLLPESIVCQLPANYPSPQPIIQEVHHA